ncbi:MAG TPA: O-antigen ligase family protein [Thermoanaerobaculia bacterium]
MARRKERMAPAPPPAGPTDPGVSVAAAILALLLLACWFAVDTGAEASFDAPKRLATLAGVAIAAAAAFFPGRSTDSGFSPLGGRRAVIFLAAAAIAGAAVSALLSARRGPAFDTLRVLLLYALFLPLGASRVLEKRGAALASLFVGCAAASGVVSLLQARGSFQPFRLVTAGHRENTTAFVGAIGLLAVALALAALIALGAAITTSRPAVRFSAVAALAAIGAGLAANQNLTAFTALAAGCLALLVCLLRRRALIPLLSLAMLGAAAFALYPPLRARASDALVAVRVGDWDRLTTYRLGPWNAALEMIRQRPLAGVGPGNFTAEFVDARLAAEIRAGRRFVNPLLTSSYGEAHSEYLQAFSDLGIPAGACAIAAVLLLLAATARRAFAEGRADPEAAILFALLVAGATAALTWFPLQRPVTAIPLLLAAGRAWRRLR